MSDDKYNGWTNYETWAVKLWIDNDESTANYWADKAQEIWDEANDSAALTRDENAQYDLSNAMKDEIKEGMPELTGMYSDLLTAAIDKVDFDEIAGYIIENDVDKYK